MEKSGGEASASAREAVQVKILESDKQRLRTRGICWKQIKSVLAFYKMTWRKLRYHLLSDLYLRSCSIERFVPTIRTIQNQHQTLLLLKANHIASSSNKKPILNRMVTDAKLSTEGKRKLKKKKRWGRQNVLFRTRVWRDKQKTIDDSFCLLRDLPHNKREIYRLWLKTRK